jgi:predicted DNA-binding protein
MRKMTSFYLSPHDRERLERLQAHLGTKSMAETLRTVIRAYLSFYETPTKDADHVHH